MRNFLKSQWLRCALALMMSMIMISTANATTVESRQEFVEKCVDELGSDPDGVLTAEEYAQYLNELKLAVCETSPNINCDPVSFSALPINLQLLFSFAGANGNGDFQLVLSTPEGDEALETMCSKMFVYLVQYGYVIPAGNIAPSISPTVIASNNPTSVLSRFPSEKPSSLPSQVPSPTPSIDLSTSQPSIAGASENPTSTPSEAAISENPTFEPSKAGASENPSSEPFQIPSPTPSIDLSTSQPSIAGASENPTSKPSEAAISENPTFEPSKAGASENPTSEPSESAISENPTFEPSKAGASENPTSKPSEAAVSENPTSGPSQVPSPIPSLTSLTTPTNDPSQGPTLELTAHPTVSSSLKPSIIIQNSSDPSNFPTSLPNSPTDNPSPALIANAPTGIPSTKYASTSPSGASVTASVPSFAPATSAVASAPSNGPTGNPSDGGTIVTVTSPPMFAPSFSPTVDDQKITASPVTSFSTFAPSSGGATPTAAPIIDPTTSVKVTVQFYYLIELNRVFTVQEIQSGTNNTIEGDLSSAIIFVLSSSDSLSRRRLHNVRDSYHSVDGQFRRRRSLAIDANVTHDLVNDVDCPDNQSQGSCFYITSAVVVTVVQTLDPVGVILDTIENAMSPVSDNFLNAMENSDTEEVTFGGQGIYERSDLPDAIIVQSDEGDELDTTTLVLIVVAGGLLLFVTAISVAICRRREKYIHMMDDGVSTEEDNADVEDMELGVYTNTRTSDKQLAFLGHNSMLVEFNEDESKRVSGYEIRETSWDDGEDKEHIMKFETISANSIPQFVVPSGMVSNSDTISPKEQSDAELMELAIEAGKWIDVATYARALNVGDSDSGSRISPLSSTVYNNSKSIGSSGSRTKLSEIDQKRAAVIDTFVELRNWNAVIDTAEKFGQNRSLEDALQIPLGHQELNVQNTNSSLSVQASSMSLKKSTSSSSGKKVNTGVVSEAVRRQKVEGIRKQIITLLVDAAPHEINNVDAMMEQFHGKEEDLVETIRLMNQRQKMEGKRLKQVEFTGVDSVASSVKDCSATHSALDSSALSGPVLGSMLPDDQSASASSVSEDKAKIMDDLNKAIEAGDWRQVEERASALHQWESDDDDENHASSFESAITGSYGRASWGQTSSDLRSAVSGLSSPSAVSSAASSAFESIDSSLFGAEDAMKLEAIEGLMETEDWEGLVALTNKRSASVDSSAQSNNSDLPSDEGNKGYGVTG